MRIVELWNTDLKQSYALFNTFPKEENGFVNNAYGYTFEKFIDYVCAKAENSKSRNLQKGFVPDTVYILINDDEKYVGIFNFRHYLNEFLRDGPGHIGYGISPEYRGKGYASKGLSLVLYVARKIIPEDEIYLECFKTNKASLQVQLHNGAYIHHETDDHYLTRIKQ